VDSEGRREPSLGALNWAVSSLNVSNVRLLLERGARVDDIDPDASGPFALAAENLQLDMVAMMLGVLGPDHDEINRAFYGGATPLWVCVNSSLWGRKDPTDNVKIVSLLLSAHAMPTAGPDGSWPLHKAAMLASVELVSVLLEAGNCDVDQLPAPSEHAPAGHTPLMAACRQAQWSKERARADSDSGEESDGEFVAPPIARYEAVVQRLLAAKANVDLLTPTGESALSLASHSAPLLKLLLAARADVAHLVCSPVGLHECCCAKCKQSIVHKALERAKGNPECVALLQAAADRAAAAVADALLICGPSRSACTVPCEAPRQRAKSPLTVHRHIGGVEFEFARPGKELEGRKRRQKKRGAKRAAETRARSREGNSSGSTAGSLGARVKDEQEDEEEAVPVVAEVAVAAEVCDTASEGGQCRGDKISRGAGGDCGVVGCERAQRSSRAGAFYHAAHHAAASHAAAATRRAGHPPCRRPPHERRWKLSSPLSAGSQSHRLLRSFAWPSQTQLRSRPTQRSPRRCALHAPASPNVQMQSDKSPYHQQQVRQGTLQATGTAMRTTGCAWCASTRPRAICLLAACTSACVDRVRSCYSQRMSGAERSMLRAQLAPCAAWSLRKSARCSSEDVVVADYTVKGGKQVDNVLKRMSISHLSHVKEDEKLYRCH